GRAVALEVPHRSRRPRRPHRHCPRLRPPHPPPPLTSRGWSRTLGSRPPPRWSEAHGSSTCLNCGLRTTATVGWNPGFGTTSGDGAGAEEFSQFRIEGGAEFYPELVGELQHLAT